MKTVNIPDSIHAELAEISKQYGTRINFLVEGAVRQFIDSAAMPISRYEIDQTQPNPRTKARTKAQKRTALAQKAQD